MIERSSAVTRPIGTIVTIAIAFSHVATADGSLESWCDQPRLVVCRIFASTASYSRPAGCCTVSTAAAIVLSRKRRILPGRRHESEAVILQIAAQMIEEHGSEAEGAAIGFANLMLDHRERERQVEWLRVRVPLLRSQDIPARSTSMTAAARS
jgi:hypothetical protein